MDTLDTRNILQLTDHSRLDPRRWLSLRMRMGVATLTLFDIPGARYNGIAVSLTLRSLERVVPVVIGRTRMPAKHHIR